MTLTSVDHWRSVWQGLAPEREVWGITIETAHHRYRLSEDKQQVRINHSLKYHHWLDSNPLPKGHISAQIGLDLQPNPQWQFGLSIPTRIGPDLRDQAISFNLTEVF